MPGIKNTPQRQPLVFCMNCADIDDMFRVFITSLLFAGLFLFPATLSLAEENEKGLSDKQLIEKAESYLQALGSARARFVQTTHNGVQLVGTFYLDRPGKLKFEYDPPIEDFIVADGFFIYFYDAESEQQTNAPIGQTLADFILREDIELSGDLKVTDIKKAGGLAQITVIQAADPDAGSLTLGFQDDPFYLKKWRVVDAQGLITEVELFYLKTDVTHPGNLFVFVHPETQSSRPTYNE